MQRGNLIHPISHSEERIWRRKNLILFFRFISLDKVNIKASIPYR